MNVLISSAGRRVSLVRAFQKELKILRPAGRVFATDARPELSAACRISDEFAKMPMTREKGYMDKLLSYCLENDITLVIPTIDTELKLFSIHKSDFLKKGIHLLVCDISLVEKCRDKRLIHKFFVENGIKVATEYERDNYKLPMFLKPIDGSRSVDTFLIEKENELTNYHKENKKLMFLEYLDHKEHEEYTCDLYYDKFNRLKCAVPRKRIEVRDGEVNKGITEKGHIVDYIKERLAYVEGAVGCVTAQFFKNKETNAIYGIEINPRFGGGFPLSYLSGANYPKWLLQEYFFNQEIEDSFNCWEDNLLMLRYDDEILVHDYKS